MEKYTGLSEEAAHALAGKEGLQVRITARDGHYYMVTMDLRSNRINFRIDGGLVTKAYIG